MPSQADRDVTGANKQTGKNRAGPGRPKGSQNKVTGAIKDMILQALTNKGGVEYLERQADANPVAFMGLVGKAMPLQLTGDGGGPIQTEDVSLRDAPDEVVRWLASQRHPVGETHH